MKKGFTLVELLATIVIIGVIAGIAISLVGDSIKSGREKISDEQKTLIEEACKNYMAENVLKKDDITCEVKKVSDLVNDGYIENNKINEYLNENIKVDYKKGKCTLSEVCE